MTTFAAAPGPFVNEVVRSFADPADRASIEMAIGQVRLALGRAVPLLIGGETVTGPGTIPSINPSRPSEVVGDVVAGTPQDVNDALDAAGAAFGPWSRTPVEERAALLFRAAGAVRERKDWFNALMIFEVGKTWVEADADTAEAIDFLEFYGREALRHAVPAPLVPSPYPEDNVLRYLPLGVGAVIPPWNFALAIMAGMTAAAIVTGNTVVLKPSPDAAVVAAAFVDLLHELGLPPGVVNFLPGDGLTVGEALVTDRRTRFISFTGSKGVGLRINELAAKTVPGQRWIKRVIAEMGGKDAIVVASDADFDAAVDGVIGSAYGFAGQKCSACSRAIVDASIYDRFVDALAARAARPPRRRPRRRRDGSRPGDQPALVRQESGVYRDRPRRGPRGGRRGRGVQRRVLHRADRHRRRGSPRAHRSGRDLRTRAGRDPLERLRRGAGDRQRHGIRADRRGLHAGPRPDRPGPGRVLRRQPLHQ